MCNKILIFFVIFSYSIVVYTSGSIVPEPVIEFTGQVVDYAHYRECLQVKAEDEDTPFDSNFCIMSTYLEIVSLGAWVGWDKGKEGPGGLLE